MGSPISSYIAEIKLRLLENSFIESNNYFKLWVRYVDDIFAIIKPNYNPQSVLDEINKMDKNLKFTLEEEKDNTINFLDVKIIKIGNNLDTTVYRKPTNSNEIIHARASTPYNYKIAALRSYINRAIEICSNRILLNKEIKIIKKIAKNAGYEENLIVKIYENRIKKLNKIDNAQPQKKTFTRAIPYDQGICNKIKYFASKFNINIPIKPNPNNFQRLRNDKDTIPADETSGVYKINYNTTSKSNKEYIGISKRKLKNRLKEHLYDLKNLKNTTAIAKDNCNNPIDLNSITIEKIVQYNSLNYALNREAIEIFCSDDAINETGSIQIPLTWQPILGEKKRMRKGGAGGGGCSESECGQWELLSSEDELGWA